MHQQYFMNMIQSLRQKEEVILYANVLQTGEAEQREVTDFLHREYLIESLDYPSDSFSYNPEAALWGAKTVYFAAQLILYRNHPEKDLRTFFPAFEHAVDAQAIVSADLCLRFLPDMLHQLEAIDPADALIPILVEIAETWHYSAIRYTLETDALNFEPIVSDSALLQLYTDRVIRFKNNKLSAHPLLQKQVRANLGLYADHFWKAFKLEQHDE